jgi:hypothetical protein
MTAVLQAIQGLRAEVKAIRDDVAVLKRKVNALQAPATATADAGSAPVEAKPKPAPAPRAVAGKLEPGWIVWAYDFPCCGNANFSADPLGGFPFTKTIFNTSMHANSIPTSNNVAYKAEGFYSATETGKYTFTISFAEHSTCGAGLEIDGTSIISFRMDGRDPGQTLQGSKELNGVPAKMTIYFGCYPRNGTTIKLLVRAPGDLVPREVSINEISHKVGS